MALPHPHRSYCKDSQLRCHRMLWSEKRLVLTSQSLMHWYCPCCWEAKVAVKGNTGQTLWCPLLQGSQKKVWCRLSPVGESEPVGKEGRKAEEGATGILLSMRDFCQRNSHLVLHSGILPLFLSYTTQTTNRQGILLLQLVSYYVLYPESDKQVGAGKREAIFGWQF